ncbi:MAG: glycosyltransferase family 25 protein [Planctomycetes bacterium]|nr:glycosyltransferase family 25 protein [Planctomycetota bacterium]
MKFREFFGRISIINLPERTDRRTEMLKELEKASLTPEPGRIEFFPAVRVSEAAGFTNRGVHGCFLSHLGVLKQARDAGLANVLVLEDDAEIASRFREDEESLVEFLRTNDWGFVYFGHALETPADRTTTLKRYYDGVSLAHFYAVNGKYLDRLVRFLETVLTRPAGDPDGGPMDVDGAFHFFQMRNPDVPCHVASPNLATQRSSRSDLSPKWFDKIPVLHQTIAFLRKVKRRLKRR